MVGGGEVDLLREAHAGVILDDAEWLVHAAGEVEGIPCKEVLAEVVHGSNTVFNVLK